MSGRKNNGIDNIIGIIILIAGAIVALGIIKWLFSALFKIAIIIVAIAIVVWVLSMIFGADSSSKPKQSYYVDERGHKVYTKKPVAGKDIVVESKVINCPGCNISLSSSIGTCPKCGTQIK